MKKIIRILGCISIMLLLVSCTINTPFGTFHLFEKKNKDEGKQQILDGKVQPIETIDGADDLDALMQTLESTKSQQEIVESIIAEYDKTIEKPERIKEYEERYGNRSDYLSRFDNGDGYSYITSDTIKTIIDKYGSDILVFINELEDSTKVYTYNGTVDNVTYFDREVREYITDLSGFLEGNYVKITDYKLSDVNPFNQEKIDTYIKDGAYIINLIYKGSTADWEYIGICVTPMKDIDYKVVASMSEVELREYCSGNVGSSSQETSDTLTDIEVYADRLISILQDNSISLDKATEMITALQAECENICDAATLIEIANTKLSGTTVNELFAAKK